MTRSELITSEIGAQCADRGLDLMLPDNAFIVATTTAQGLVVEGGFRDLGAAVAAAKILEGGDKKTYLMNANKDHGLLQMNRGNPEPAHEVFFPRA